MSAGFEPYRTPVDDGAIDRAKEFCSTRGLTPETAKIVKRDGFVRVVIKKSGVRLK